MESPEVTQYYFPPQVSVKHGRIAGKSQSLLGAELSEVLRKGL